MADYSNQDPSKRVTQDGKTYKDLQELADQQQFGEEPMIKANINPEVKIQAFIEKTHYVLDAEAPLFDQETGEKLSRPVRHVLDIRQFDEWTKKDRLAGQRVKIHHDPTKGPITPRERSEQRK